MGPSYCCRNHKVSPSSPGCHSTRIWVVLDLPMDVPESGRGLRLHMVPALRRLNPALRWNVSSYSNHTQQVKCKAWASPPVQPAKLSVRKIWFAKANIQQSKRETSRYKVYFTYPKPRKSDLSFWQLLHVWGKYQVSFLKLMLDIQKNTSFLQKVARRSLMTKKCTPVQQKNCCSHARNTPVHNAHSQSSLRKSSYAVNSCLAPSWGKHWNKETGGLGYSRTITLNAPDFQESSQTLWKRCHAGKSKHVKQSVLPPREATQLALETILTICLLLFETFCKLVLGEEHPGPLS